MAVFYKPLSDDCTKVDTPSGSFKRRIGGVANRSNFGKIILGVRRYCPLMRENIADYEAALNAHERMALKMEQGFVDQYGTFMDREEAMKVAVASGQIMREVGGPSTVLYSEHLY